jgi:hypothetical protein
MKTIIEIQKWNDSDVLITDCIMVSKGKFNENDLVREFCGLSGIVSTSGIPNKILPSITNDFIIYLELKGFTKLKTYKIHFSD